MSIRLSQVSTPAPGIQEIPVEFEGITGILTIPADHLPQKALIFSHGWGGYRCGPANLLVQLARDFAQAGYACMRFDYTGRGESQGDGTRTTLATMSVDLQKAAGYLLQRYNTARLTLCGLCSGGNVIIGTLPNLPQTEKLLLISVYPFSDGDRFLQKGRRLRQLLKSYLAKACSLSNWKRLFSGEASLLRVLSVLFKPFSKKAKQKKEEALSQPPQPHGPQKASQNESRLHSPEQAPTGYLAAFRKDLPALLVYGSADPDAENAEKYYRRYAEAHNLPHHFSIIPGATHNFTAPAHRKSLRDILLAFLTDKN